MSDEQQGGWTRPERETAAPHPGWAPQQPPAASRSWGQPVGGYAPVPPPPPKPGIIPLRPLGVGEILDGAISAIRAYPKVMLGLSALVAAATQVISVPLTWLLVRDSGESFFTPGSTTPADPGAQLSAAAGVLVSAGVQVLVTLIATLALTGILTVVVSRAVMGQQISAREAWQQARPRILPLLGFTFFALLGLLVAAALLALPALAVGLSGGPTWLVVVLGLLGSLALVLGLVNVYPAFSLAPPIIVLERQSPLASLRRARSLVKGAWWRTVGLLLLVTIIAQFLSNALAVPFVALSYGVAFATGSGTDIFALLPLIVTALGTIAAAAITWPFTAVSTALVYIDRRMRREALDLELLRAAGLTTMASTTTDRG